MSPVRFVKGESDRSRKIHVDSAALTHRPSLDLRLKGRVLRPFCAKLCGPMRSSEEREGQRTETR